MQAVVWDFLLGVQAFFGSEGRVLGFCFPLLAIINVHFILLPPPPALD